MKTDLSDLPRSTPRMIVRVVFCGLAALAATAVQAQPLVLQVNPRGPMTGQIEVGGKPVTVAALFEAGPRYTVENGIGRRVGIGSSVPSWIEMGSFRNQSIPGLNPSGYYGYFISPDDKAVVVDLDSRRIVRVLSQ
ncbi:hypothetical protein [Methylobacterium sp.]|uniref:hypothetical protein n=1 Tax=Methylobacterium sp. TaxID=409 RepID=UPI0025F617E6|nr:hypothetical protein [Methylobacterium sp.]